MSAAWPMTCWLRDLAPSEEPAGLVPPVITTSYWSPMQTLNASSFFHHLWRDGISIRVTYGETVRIDCI